MLNRYLVLAAAASVVVVATSPFMGLIRDLLLREFPRSALKTLGYVLILLAAWAFGWAVLQIRQHRRWRFGGLVLVALLLVWQTYGFGTGDASVDMVEKIHIVEYGLIAYLLLRGFSSRPVIERCCLALLGVLIAGTLDESVQALFQMRVGEIRDVALNGFAGVCGLLFGLCVHPPSRSERWLAKGTGQALAVAAGLAVLLVGVFFYRFHLGYDIVDPELGRFRSWFSAQELARLKEQRQQQWREDPPTGLVAWHLEDYYLTEAGSWAQHRNERYGSSDWYMAAQANRFLEKYYDPFLDLESFRGSGRHRYGPEVRGPLENQAGPPRPESYVSPVQQRRIYVWPSKPAYLWALTAVLGLLWGWPAWATLRPRLKAQG